MKHNKILTPYAKELRKNMTKQERHLWYDFLRNYPVRFLRQKVIEHYIVDFYCSKANLVIEIDGGQHYQDENIISDELRTKTFEKYNLKVIRFTNIDIDKNFEGVCNTIDNIVRESLPR
jgi:DNA (cytosine-5-)-methyltransferase